MALVFLYSSFLSFIPSHDREAVHLLFHSEFINVETLTVYNYASTGIYSEGCPLLLPRIVCRIPKLKNLTANWDAIKRASAPPLSSIDILFPDLLYFNANAIKLDNVIKEQKYVRK